MTVWETK